MPKSKSAASLKNLDELIKQAMPVSQLRSAKPASTKEERSALMKERLDAIYAGHEWMVVGKGYADPPAQGSSGYRVKHYFVVQAADDPNEKRIAGATELRLHAKLVDAVPAD